DKNKDNLKANKTKHYLKEIEEFPPKILLAHFLMHVAGFLHGGAIIKKTHIDPNNKLTFYKIPSAIYDFSSAMNALQIQSGPSLYANIMKEVDKIPLTVEEYRAVNKACVNSFTTMIGIYDELCKIYI